LNSTLSLDHYRLLGRSGLRVSPFSLGTMTFGTDWGWGAEQEEAQRIFDIYVERGGNFIDTANQYTDGTAERMIGQFAAHIRDRLVIATKYTLPIQSGDPNSGGNHRKSMVRSVEMSLRRLQTDYIDLLYLHFWDATTSPDEILRAMDDLVHAGKVLYLGVSDIVSWQVARMQAIADLRGWSPLIALQIEYSLAERTVERDLIPMAREMGLGVVPWAPLAAGALTGKYQRSDLVVTDESTPEGSRRKVVTASGRLSERIFFIVDTLKSIADESGRSPSQIALAWTLLNPSVTSTIIGARTSKQLTDNLSALDVRLTEAQHCRLSEVSAIELGFPHDYLIRLASRGTMFGGLKVTSRRQ